MAYLVNGKRVLEQPEHGVLFQFENPCTEDGGHAYAEKICPKCGADFCWACCGNTNVHEGGKYEPDFMTCPKCGHDIYGSY